MLRIPCRGGWERVVPRGLDKGGCKGLGKVGNSVGMVPGGKGGGCEVPLGRGGKGGGEACMFGGTGGLKLQGAWSPRPTAYGYQGICWTCGEVGHKASECIEIRALEEESKGGGGEGPVH